MATQLFTGLGTADASFLGLTGDDDYLIAADDAGGVKTVTDLGGTDSITVEAAATAALAYDGGTKTWTVRNVGDSDNHLFTGIETVTLDQGTVTAGEEQLLVETDIDAGTDPYADLGATASILDFDGFATETKASDWEIFSVDGKDVAGSPVPVTDGVVEFDSGDATNNDFTFTPDPSILDALKNGESRTFSLDVVYDDVNTDTEGDATITYDVTFTNEYVGTNEDEKFIGTFRADGAEGSAIDMGAGSDVAYGYQGDDVIDGGAGQDWLFGGSGSDTLTTGKGDNDTVRGEGGNDVIDVTPGNDDTKWVFGGDGFDQITVGTLDAPDADGAVVLNAFGGKGKDIIQGGAGDDKLVGNRWADELTGNKGNDELDGGFGDDILDGGDGADTILGGPGDDDITAGDGADTVTPGSGDNTVDLGETTAATDTVIFGVDDTGTTTISNFTTDEDTIDLTAFFDAFGSDVGDGSKGDFVTAILSDSVDVDDDSTEDDSVVSIGDLTIEVLDVTLAEDDFTLVV